eukprot:1150391-Rhodomonas_salina.1
MPFFIVLGIPSPVVFNLSRHQDGDLAYLLRALTCGCLDATGAAHVKPKPPARHDEHGPHRAMPRTSTRSSVHGRDRAVRALDLPGQVVRGSVGAVVAAGSERAAVRPGVRGDRLAGHRALAEDGAAPQPDPLP